MELKQRLIALRQQRGEDTAEANAVPEIAGVGQRLQRLTVSPSPDRPAAVPDDEVAQLLRGRLVADGLIVVEHRLPLTHQHGQHRLASLLARPYALPALAQRLPIERLIFLDTETTGLAGGTGTLAFLLGVARVVDQELHLSQFFLTGFRGETALLQAATAWATGGEYLVTFNGKSFDAPLLTTRYRLAGLADPFAALQHLDLLHAVRRAFARQWPDCRLLTAERRLLGFHRRHDLPSSLVPEVWFGFVRRGQTRQLPGILTHNRWDLLSLVGLLQALADTFTTPAAHGADVVAVARYWLHQGDEHMALQFLESHRPQLPQDGLLTLARLYRRRRVWAEAVRIWQQLAAQDCAEALECLAKYHEHECSDPFAALALTQRLQQVEGSNQAHAHRALRLAMKISRTSAAPVTPADYTARSDPWCTPGAGALRRKKNSP